MLETVALTNSRSHHSKAWEALGYLNWTCFGSFFVKARVRVFYKGFCSQDHTGKSPRAWAFSDLRYKSTKPWNILFALWGMLLFVAALAVWGINTRGLSLLMSLSPYRQCSNTPAAVLMFTLVCNIYTKCELC